MVDLTQMSDEELDAQIAQEDLQSLSDAELDLMLAKEEKRQLQSEVSGVESGIRGAAQGLTMGFADEIEGAVVSAMTDKSYSDARDESRVAYEKAREANPGIYTTAEITGGVASAVATGATGSIAIAGLGAVAGAGFSQAESAEGVVEDAAYGAAFSFAGDRIIKGAGKGLKALFNRSSKTAKSALGEVSREIPENTRFREATIKDIYLGKYNTADDYFLSDKAVDRAIQGIDESVELIDNVVGKEMSSLGTALKIAKHDVGDIKLNLSNKFVNFEQGVAELQKTMAITKKAGDYLNKNIVAPMKEGINVNGNQVRLTSMNIEEAHTIKQMINRLRFSKGDEGILFKDAPEANQLLKEFSDDLINTFNDADPSGTLRGINQQFSKLYNLQDVLPQSSGDVQSLLSTMSTSKSAVKGRQLITTAHAYSPEMAANLYDVINPRLKLLSAVSSARSLDLGAGTAFRIKAGAGLAGPIGGILAGGKQAAVLAGNIITKTARDAFKFPRSVGAVFQNADLSISKMSAISVPLAMELQMALDNNDKAAVGQIMSAALQDPAASAEFDKGMGFEGKAVTPEEIALVENGIRSRGLSLSQQMQMMSNFSQTRMIPGQEDVPENQRVDKIYKATMRKNGIKIPNY